MHKNYLREERKKRFFNDLKYKVFVYEIKEKKNCNLDFDGVIDFIYYIYSSQNYLRFGDTTHSS